MKGFPATRRIPLRLTDDGWHILEIRGARDVPDYDPEEVGQGLSENAYRREILGDWSAASGKIVYPEFGAIHQARDPLPFDPKRPLICGWDVGGSAFTGTPAFVPTQLSAAGQWYLWEAVIPPDDTSIGIWEFAWETAERLTERFCHPHGIALSDLKLIHWGDPAGNNRMPITKAAGNAVVESRSCYDIIRRGIEYVVGEDGHGNPVADRKPGFGWRIRSGEVSLAKRMEAMRSRLTALRYGEPMLLVDPGARILLDGFLGGYHYHQRSDGRFELDPMKNWYSHPMNALEYVASRLTQSLSVTDEDDEPDYGWHRQRTRAPGHRSFGRW